MRVTIIGLGLIGGSLALALKKERIGTYIIGVNRNKQNADKALELGIADEIMTLEEGVKNTDVVILALPVDIIEQLLPSILDQIGLNTTVIDLGSTKQGICNIVDNHPKRKNFVATHPIAGTENSGPESAFAELYIDKTTIICDEKNSSDQAVKITEDIFKTIGSKIIKMNSDEHDKHIAYVSHLSHISSFALGAAVLEIEKDEKNIFNMAGSGFSSTVRLAKSSPAMWTPIFKQNKNNILEAIEAYETQLQHIKNALEMDDYNYLYNYMEKANKIRKILK